MEYLRTIQRFVKTLMPPPPDIFAYHAVNFGFFFNLLSVGLVRSDRSTGRGGGECEPVFEPEVFMDFFNAVSRQLSLRFVYTIIYTFHTSILKGFEGIHKNIKVKDYYAKRVECCLSTL